ncbi:dethiobiotin synthetase [Rhodoblastus acidophilus]|uniref:dethiobiotin synthase n=1 Tax=Rhodoblastus acidophilus TaxID=1074 RepID=UPI002224E480|nr:dethiobiotin synthase [Rhodoblastus acidophilus]MCW2283134.1 dethiobiotin synthetase [Rhodoblastus acidophilus]MCW2331815.1 dethiobiotin synthetase [Rhodoblastus acidophilus]
MKTFFVTSTGTGIGKTFTTCALIRQARARGLKVAATKPLISGFDNNKIPESDTGAILQALGEPPTPEAVARVSPWRFSAPLAPNMAAAAEGLFVDCDALFAHSRAFLAEPADVRLIEGVGGVMVPLDDSKTVLDWISACGCPAILVVGDYLGTISHTLTAIEVLRARGVPLAAVVVSEGEGREVPFVETCAELGARLKPAPVVALPRNGSGAELASALAGSRL